MEQVKGFEAERRKYEVTKIEIESIFFNNFNRQG